MKVTSTLQVSLERENGSRSPQMETAVPSGAPYATLDRTTDEIRLIKIVPTHSEGTVRCQIASYPFDEVPEYLALSYHWGNEDPDCNIELNGKIVNVRKNLLRFFTHIPSRFMTSYLWIDALCIDQSDQQERTHQVGMMARIYSRASSVLVWLGPAYDDSDLAMMVIARNHAYWDSRSFAKIWLNREGQALRRLCNRAYWTRLWVVQELVLARRAFLLCGQQQVPWQSFERLLSAVQANPPTRRGAHRTEYKLCVSSPASSMIAQLEGHHEDRTLVQLAIAFAYLECSDPRDKLYALLGIAKRSQEVVFADYTVGLSTLLNRVLTQDFALFPPKSFEEVYERACQLPAAFGWPKEMAFDLEKHDDSPEVPDEDSIQLLPLAHSTGVPLWWNLFYEHDAVTKLWGGSDALDQLYALFKTAVVARSEAACRYILRIDGLRSTIRDHDDRWSIGVLSELERTGSEVILQILLDNGCFPIEEAIRRESRMEIDAFHEKLGKTSELDNESQMAFYNKSIAGGGGVIKRLLERRQTPGRPLDFSLIDAVAESYSPGIVMTFLDSFDRISDDDQVRWYYQELLSCLGLLCSRWEMPFCHAEVLKALLARIEHRALALEFRSSLYGAVRDSHVPTVAILLDFIDKTLAPQEAGVLHKYALSKAENQHEFAETDETRLQRETTIKFLRERQRQREAEKS